MRYQFKQHRRSHEIFAVRFNARGIITGASGPLSPATLCELPPKHLIYFRNFGELIARNIEEYEPYYQEGGADDRSFPGEIRR